eukprot:scaffold151558_cov26-Tisochrysis_lutea.AAC.1
MAISTISRSSLPLLYPSPSPRPPPPSLPIRLPPRPPALPHLAHVCAVDLLPSHPRVRRDTTQLTPSGASHRPAATAVPPHRSHSWPPVAQVIAHLNTRNEDAEVRVAETEATYKAELQALSADAEAKLKALSETSMKAAKEQAQKEVAAAVAKLEEAQQAERTKAHAELDAAKAALKKREGELRAEAEAAASSAAEALRTGQQELEKRMKELEGAIATYKGNADKVHYHSSSYALRPPGAWIWETTPCC